MINTNRQFIEKIDALLPQTQCRQCGYQGCKPYAVAIASGEADINQCPPGGDTGIHALARITGRQYQPLNPAHGVYKPKAFALIDEAVCIGCTLCLQACPVDAILGANKHMHTVIASECTGCELCIAPCPVDCISMVPVGGTARNAEPALDAVNMPKSAADNARARYEFRNKRLAREKQERAQQYAQRVQASKRDSAQIISTTLHTANAAPVIQDKKATIAAAMARAKAIKIAGQT